MGSSADKLAAAYVERFGRQHWREFLALIGGFWQAVGAALERLGLDWRAVDLYQDGLPLCGREREIVTKAAATGSQNYQLLLELMSRGAGLVGTEDPKLLLKELRDVQAGVASPVARAERTPPYGSRPCVSRTSCPRVSRASRPRASSSSSSSSAAASVSSSFQNGSENTAAKEEETTEGKMPSPRAGETPATPAAHEETLTQRDAFIARRIGQTLVPGRTGVLFIGMMHHVESFLPKDIVVRRLDTQAPPGKGQPH
jgi:hypothetical protein